MQIKPEEMTDLDLRIAYQYYVDGLIDIIKRLKQAIEEKNVACERAWYNSAAYRWGRMTELHDELEKRGFLNGK